MKDIFDYNDYKHFLIDKTPTKGEERGRRSKLAQVLNCQLSYISLVLTTPNHHFNLEHGQKICEHFEMSDESTDFFLLLLSKARAGSKELERYYEKKIRTILSTRVEIKNRIKNHETLDQNDQAIYYSDWYFTALHMILRREKEISINSHTGVAGAASNIS